MGQLKELNLREGEVLLQKGHPMGLAPANSHLPCVWGSSDSNSSLLPEWLNPNMFLGDLVFVEGLHTDLFAP